MSFHVQISIFIEKNNEFVNNFKSLKENAEALNDGEKSNFVQILKSMTLFGSREQSAISKARQTIDWTYQEFLIEVSSLRYVIDHIIGYIFNTEKKSLLVNSLFHRANLTPKHKNIVLKIAEVTSNGGKSVASLAKNFKMLQTLEAIINNEGIIYNIAFIIYLQLFVKISEMIILFENDLKGKLTVKLIDIAIQKLLNIAQLYNDLYQEWKGAKETFGI